jgi:Tol biopolymer transport system component
VLLGESRDGRWIVAVRVDSGGPDIVAIQTDRDSVFRPIIATSAVETQPVLSPDNRWIAYTSDRSGNPEVYVQPFPDVDRGIWQVSIDGGAEAVWSPAGDRIYFRRGAAGIFAVDVSSSPVFSAGAPYRVLSPGQLTGAFHSRGWMLSPDGNRVLVVSAQEGEGRIRLVRVENVMSDVREAAAR